MLGFSGLSQTPLSTLPSSTTNSIGTATGTAVANGVSVGMFQSVGTATGVAIVSSINQATFYLDILRGMNRQPVDTTATITNTAISLLEAF